ncbi:MAG: RibD family protein, partial [Acetobacteraceae bacterium]|nr:RibD family protein [Acetobacteraceae bacterium]
TESLARRVAHAIRGAHDAVMVGVGTVLTDNPDLTCRIPGARSARLVRVVADSHLRTPLTSRLAATARQSPTWILIREGADRDRRAAFEDLGVTLMELDGSEMGVDIRAALCALAETGLTRLMVEGGAQLAASLLRANLVDRLAWFHAPSIMGADGWPAAQALGITELAQMPRFVRTSLTPLGPDLLSEFRRAV